MEIPLDAAAQGLRAERELGPLTILDPAPAAGGGVLRLGARGCYSGGRFYPAFPVVPVDTTSAGDTFNAALAVGLCEGQGIPQGPSHCKRGRDAFRHARGCANGGRRVCRSLPFLLAVNDAIHLAGFDGDLPGELAVDLRLDLQLIRTSRNQQSTADIVQFVDMGHKHTVQVNGANVAGRHGPEGL
ncbi:MAG: hypothetical protein FJW30_13720 [Acidobacteria bacterium]|nr:hypothetical protein [Acidobacteriota bacterium]